MARQANKTADEIVKDAMHHFWSRGYHATSMDELVKAVGATRHAIYSVFGSKHELYLHCFDAYQRQVVTPAFESVERAEGGIASIQRYIERQISAAATMGLPGPGCLVANAATETAPHDPPVAAKVDEHHRRLECGFVNALSAAAPHLPACEHKLLANVLVTYVQGLWSMSRMVSSATALRRQAEEIVSLIERKISK